MSTHGYMRRIGAPGVDLWKCQSTECRAEGPLKKLMAGECKRTSTPEEVVRDFLAAVAAPVGSEA